MRSLPRGLGASARGPSRADCLLTPGRTRSRSSGLLSRGSFAPPSLQPSARPLQAIRWDLSPSVARCHTSDPVPPSWFHTTSTVYSAQGPRVCCAPLTTLGFVTFPPQLPIGPRASLLHAVSPRRTTLRSFPFVGSRTASPRPLPSCRYQRQLPPGSVQSLQRAASSEMNPGSPHQAALASRAPSRSGAAPPPRGALSLDQAVPAPSVRSRTGAAGAPLFLAV
jgi:hypothetical protein